MNLATGESVFYNKAFLKKPLLPQIFGLNKLPGFSGRSTQEGLNHVA
jgi:hypothetical protein